MRIAIITLLAGTIALAACNESVGGPGASSHYDRGNGTRLKVDCVGGTAMVQMNDTPVTNPAATAASGTKDMNPARQFWDKGGATISTVGRMAPMTCTRLAVPRGRSAHRAPPPEIAVTLAVRRPAPARSPA